MSEDKNKYKMFRNFMVNELGITREDLESWTKQAINRELEKLLKGTFTQKVIEREIKTIMYGGLYNRRLTIEFEELIRKEISKELQGKIKLSLEQ